MLFPSVRGFLDYVGPNNPLAITWLLCCLPPLGTESASCSIGFSKLNSPAHRYLCLRFKRYLAISSARLEARMDSLLSFPVGLFHPLQHAGLARRTPACRQLGSRRGFLYRRSFVGTNPTGELITVGLAGYADCVVTRSKEEVSSIALCSVRYRGQCIA